MYKTVIGLEIHSELKTKSKMFCGCANESDIEKKPNINICPVCTGEPGSLPMANEEAIKMVIKTGLALHCEINDFSKFDRKNYFYPDLPKGYQISQYDLPLCKNGRLELLTGNCVRIRRIHLEEDTGKLTHGADYSLVDFNRAGVPLMELVTEPDIKTAAEAKNFCQELQLILRYLGVSDADMEKGQMRCEVNISLSNNDKLGTKVEVKNLNSFKAVERAIEYETKRQAEALDNGEKIIQETRGWSDEKQKTFSQRVKEEAHDYRYFPEPDLPPLTGLSIISHKLSPNLPELPQAKRERFIKDHSLPGADIEVFINNKNLADYFEEAVSELDEWLKDKPMEISREKLIKSLANYLINELPRVAGELQALNFKLQTKITPENFAEFIILANNNTISRAAAQTVLMEMFKTGVDPSHIVGEKNLMQVSGEDELGAIAEKIIANNLKVAEDYKSGKENVLQFLVGQVMKETKGRANPRVIQKILKEKLRGQ